MTVTCYKSRNRVYQRVGLTAQYIRESYEVDGLPLDTVLTDPEIYGLARAVTDSPLPEENSFKDGLPMTAVVIERKLRSGAQARITLTWGRRRNGSIVTRRQRSDSAGTEMLVQPYAVVQTPFGAGPPYIARKERLVPRGRYRVYDGQYVNAALSEVAIQIAAANFVNYLYAVNGQPMLFRGVDTVRRESGELWVWSIFEGTGWVREQLEDAIEPGQKPIAELPPLHTYGVVTTDGTPAVVPENEYLAGPPGSLFWRT